MATGTRSVLSRVTARLSRTDEQVDADVLRRRTTQHGATTISELRDRELASVSGTVRCVTLRPRTNVPALVVELYDGSTAMNLVWLGRRRIGGIEPGTYLKAHGRVTYQQGTPTMFNPAYEIVPGREH
jgi:RecG-like helicase